VASRCQWGTCLTRDNGRAVRTDGERQNSPHVLVVPRSLFAHVSKTVPTFAIFRVPYFRRPVHTGRHDKLAVGGETTARHWSGMPTEHLHAVTLCVKNCSTKKNEQKMNKRRTKEEQKKNKRRTKEEQKKNKRRTKEEQRKNKERTKKEQRKNKEEQRSKG
jgi:hypothetical protein